MSRWDAIDNDSDELLFDGSRGQMGAVSPPGLGVIDSFADFTTFEWDLGNPGFTSTALFYADDGALDLIILIGVRAATLATVLEIVA